ncbi:CvpA family protein [Wenxinia marina]|uniref:Putative membrane protein, required for colicin V production n=1 Tax=Wenxinia marina DSM 24838 TaxID=1123501 RepID=A0A0D0PB12_9RHOB|nr:CvpA family protein [Wenxinia marina]KIQ68626.1 putative membrane protein, required for colicin V production [Wenxinia marina DSM 24838]GGL67432.1 colicin V production protein CvpA [Wenxinia marina]
MEGFTLIDGAVALIIVVSALLAYSRGFVREALAIAGWIGATILAFIFADQVQPLINQLPVVGDFIGDSCELSIIAAFAAVFAVALVIFSIFTPLFSGVIQRSALGGVDQGLGFLFGVLRGILLVAVGFFVYDTVLAAQSIDMVENSRSAAIFADWTGQIENQRPEEALGWITRQYEQLVGECGAPVEAATPVAPGAAPDADAGN